MEELKARVPVRNYGFASSRLDFKQYFKLLGPDRVRGQHIQDDQHSRGGFSWRTMTLSMNRGDGSEVVRGR